MNARVFALAFVLCASSAFAQDPPPIIERQVIVQGSVGWPGREIAFLNLQNLDQIDIDVNVQFVPTVGLPIGRTFRVVAEQRRSINIGETFPELGAQAFFSVIAEAFAADDQAVAYAYDLTWHRASDLREVESRTAVIRRSPKR